MSAVFRPYILPGWSYTVLDKDDGILFFSVVNTSSRPFILRGNMDSMKKLLVMLDGSLSYPDIQDRCKSNDEIETLMSLVDALNHKNVLGSLNEEDAEIYQNCSRYLRQIEYFEDIEGSRKKAQEYQQRISNATIAILGIGGVGNWLLQGLSSVGFQKFLLIDPDSVELSNLSRQILFSQDDVGSPKVVAARNWVMRFNRDAEVETVHKSVQHEADIEEIVCKVDLFVRTAGYVPSQLGRIINKLAVKHKTPYLSVGGACVGPFYIPSKSACFGCLETKIMQISPMTFNAIQKNRRTVRDTHTPVYGPQIAINAMIAVNEIVQFFTSTKLPKSSSDIIGMNLNDFHLTHFAFDIQDKCLDCQKDKKGVQNNE